MINQGIISFGRLKDHDASREQFFKRLKNTAADLNSAFLTVKDYKQLKSIDIISDYSQIMSKIVSTYLPDKKEYLKVTT